MRLLLRPLCWLIGHGWVVTRRLKGSGHLTVYHPLAGCDAHCKRCGATWEDYESVLRVRKAMFPELF